MTYQIPTSRAQGELGVYEPLGITTHCQIMALASATNTTLWEKHLYTPHLPQQPGKADP